MTISLLLFVDGDFIRDLNTCRVFLLQGWCHFYCFHYVFSFQTLYMVCVLHPEQSFDVTDDLSRPWYTSAYMPYFLLHMRFLAFYIMLCLYMSSGLCRVSWGLIRHVTSRVYFRSWHEVTADKFMIPRSFSVSVIKSMGNGSSQWFDIKSMKTF